MTEMILLGGAGLSGAIIAAALALALSRNPNIGLLALSASAIFINELNLLTISILGISVGPADVLSVLLLGAAAATPRAPERRHLPQTVAFCGVAIVAIFTLSLLRGALVHGLPAAINEARPFIYMLSSGIWFWRSFSTAERALRAIRLLSLALAISLPPLAAYRIATNGFGGTTRVTFNEVGELVETRALNSGQSMALLLAVLVVLSTARVGSSKTNVAVALIGLGTIAGAQNRSTWVAGLAGLALLFVLLHPIKRAQLVVGGWAIALLGTTLTAFSSLLNPVFDAFAASSSDTRTYDGRVEGWLALLAQARDAGLGTQLLGFSFGQGWIRVQQGRLVEYSPHNWYLSIALRLGFIGLILVLVAFAALLHRCTSESVASGGIAPILIAVIVYCWAYSLDWYLTPYVAAAFVLAARTGPYKLGGQGFKSAFFDRSHRSNSSTRTRGG
jgi:hypothetical protein